MNPESDPQPIAESQPNQGDWIDEDFMPPVRANFQELNNLAVVSVVFGALSILLAFSWIMFVFPVAGIALAWVALAQIKRRPGEYTGREFAVVAIWLSIGLGILGTSFFVIGRREGVPFGYKRITFEMLQPNEDKNEVLPPIVNDLEEDKKKIFIRGFMYPGRQYEGIKEFILVPTIGHCKSCESDLKSTEIIRVKLEGDQATDYTQELIGVGGRLTVDEAQAANPFGGVPYQISASCIR